MSLPKDKKDKLGDKVAADLDKVVQDTFKDLRKHEVDVRDAHDILVDGWTKAGKKKLPEDAK